MSAQKSHLLRSGMVTSLATFASRILGLVRDMAIAGLLGAGLASDVFFFANRIPNFFRRLFAEGAFSQAFVPVMTQATRDGDEEEMKRLLSSTAGTLGLIVGGLSLLGMLISPVITALFGYGWFQAWLDDGPEAHKFVEASDLLRITFPYLFFITLTALSSAVLNIAGRFLIPALTPCVLNVVLIAAAYFIAPHFADPNVVLAWAMVAGGVLQLLFQVPLLVRLKKLVRPSWGWNHPGVVRIRTLMIPGIIGVSAGQLNLLVNTILATFLATGAISYLYYSDRLLEFPIGMFAVAISTVILPALSRIDIKTDPGHYTDTLDWGVRLVLLLGLPSMFGIMALREPILRTLFMHGAFTPEHVLCASRSLLASISGLIALMLVRVLVQGFAALQDTKTPVRCSLIAIAANIVFNLILVWPLGYVGLALSTALAAYLNAGSLLYILKKRQIYSPSGVTLKFLLRVLTAAVVMGVVVRCVSPEAAAWAAMSTLEAVLWLTLMVGLGAVTYFVTALVLGVRPRELKR